MLVLVLVLVLVLLVPPSSSLLSAVVLFRVGAEHTVDQHVHGGAVPCDAICVVLVALPQQCWVPKKAHTQTHTRARAHTHTKRKGTKEEGQTIIPQSRRKREEESAGRIPVCQIGLT